MGILGVPRLTRQESDRTTLKQRVGRDISVTESYDRVCRGCGQSEEQARLEPCSGCGRYFCNDCAVRAGFGRKFCSADCGRAYYFSGEIDDDEDTIGDDE